MVVFRNEEDETEHVLTFSEAKEYKEYVCLWAIASTRGSMVEYRGDYTPGRERFYQEKSGYEIRWREFEALRCKPDMDEDMRTWFAD